MTDSTWREKAFRGKISIGKESRRGNLLPWEPQEKLIPKGREEEK